MNAWDRHWFGPVALVRLYLFQKCFVLIVAIDAIVLMIERGARYGIDGFNVAHSRWLDLINEQLFMGGVPGTTYYVATLVLTSFLGCWLFLRGHHPVWAAGFAVLYTYSWCMSRLDSYLHHYLISLILGCLIVFPRVEAEELELWILSTLPMRQRRTDRESKREKKQRFDEKKEAQGSSEASQADLLFKEGWLRAAILGLLAVGYRVSLSGWMDLAPWERWISMFLCLGVLVGLNYRWQRPRGWGQIPVISAWGFRLLGTTVGVVYIFTSIAKMDASWCSGHTLRAVGATEFVLQPLVTLVGKVGIPSEWFWSALATFVIPLELTLAVSYLVAIRQDEPGRVWLRRWSFCAWLLALGLHLNNEMMNLVIQWFGYYMLFLATAFLLPARVLGPLSLLFVWPEMFIRRKVDPLLRRLSLNYRVFLVGGSTLVAIAVMIFVGQVMVISGVRVASILLALGLMATFVIGFFRGRSIDVVRTNLTAIAIGLLWMGLTLQSSVRFDYFDLRGKTLQQMGQHIPAIEAMTTALSLGAPNSIAAAETETNLGLSYGSTGQNELSLQHFRDAVRLDPRQFLAYYSLGNAYVRVGRHEDAIQAYLHAIEIKPDFSDAYANLGSVMEFLGKYPEAIGYYRKALEIEPKAADVQSLLDAALAKQANFSRP